MDQLHPACATLVLGRRPCSRRGVVQMVYRSRNQRVTWWTWGDTRMVCRQHAKVWRPCGWRPVSRSR